jgi:hypothetical protein
VAAKAYENYKLQHHAALPMCIRKSPGSLMMMAKEQLVRHLYAGDLLCDAIGPLLRPER